MLYNLLNGLYKMAIRTDEQIKDDIISQNNDELNLDNF